MDYPFTTRALVNLAAGLALLVIMGLASVFLVIQAQRAAESAAHTQGAVDELTTLRMLSQDVELAERAWRLTGERAALAPIARAWAEVTEGLERLDDVTATDPAQRARLGAIRDLVWARVAAAGQLDLAGAATGAAGEAVAGSLHLDLDSRLATAVDAETRLLAERRSRAAAAATLASWFVSLAFAVGLGIVTVLLVRARRDLTAQWQAKRDLQRAHRSLIASMDDATHRTAEIAKLTELSELLQSCMSVDDAWTVIARVTSELLPADAGSVSVLGPSQALLETVSTFGGSKALALFAADDCWALRRGRLHRSDDHAGSLDCHHHEGPPVEGTLCMPLMAQGETLGVVSVRPRPGVTPTQPPAVRERLLTAAAQQIGVAIANLRLRESLRQQSIRDPLTGLFNRRFLEESLAREVRRAERHNAPVSVLMLDVDHFKRFNDSWGHKAGDLVLREIGATLGQSVRDGDVACRFGGEEFAIVMPDAPFEVALLRAEHLRLRVKTIAVAYGEQALGAVTLSIGVASYRTHGRHGEQVLRAADEALFLAKQAGRDRVAGAEQSTGNGVAAPLARLRVVPPYAETLPLVVGTLDLPM